MEGITDTELETLNKDVENASARLDAAIRNRDDVAQQRILGTSFFAKVYFYCTYYLVKYNANAETTPMNTKYVQYYLLPSLNKSTSNTHALFMF